MSTITRRSLMRNSAMAASAATLGAGQLSAAAEGSAGNVFHIFAFQWKPEASEAQKERAAKDITAFQGKIDGLLETHVGQNLSPHGKGYTFGGVMRFKDKAALDGYVVSPMHQALLKWLLPLIDPIELDLQA